MQFGCKPDQWVLESRGADRGVGCTGIWRHPWLAAAAVVGGSAFALQVVMLLLLEGDLRKAGGILSQALLVEACEG